MTLIILLAIIGSEIDAGTWYWICYGIHILFFVIKAVAETIKEMM